MERDRSQIAEPPGSRISNEVDQRRQWGSWDKRGQTYSDRGKGGRE